MLSRCLNTVSWAACILKRYYLYPTFKFVMLITQLLAGRMLRAEYKCHGAGCQRATAERVKYIFTGARGWNASAMFSAIVSVSFPPTLSTLGSEFVCLFYVCGAECECVSPRRTCFATLAWFKNRAVLTSDRLDWRNIAGKWLALSRSLLPHPPWLLLSAGRQNVGEKSRTFS